MALPFFSLIIPTFNSAQTLSRCFESILSQTFSDVEILVIDGGSTDETVKLVVDIAKDTGIVRWVSEKDRGIYDAMNKGVALAKGQWLCFLGSDDYFHDEKVLEDVALKVGANPKSRLVYGDVLTSLGYVQKFEHFSFDRLIVKNICHQAIFYHLSLFGSMNYDVSLKLLADWDFNLKVYKEKNRPLYINRLITVYNLNGASANWLTGDEYINNFKDRRRLYILHRGISSYYRYLFRMNVYKVKKAIKSFLQA